MVSAAGPGLWGARPISLAIGGDTSILGLPLLTWIVLIVILAAVFGIVFMIGRKRKRQRIVSNLQKLQPGMPVQIANAPTGQKPAAKAD